MIEGKTKKGFKFKIDEGRLEKDYRFTLALAKTNSSDPVAQAEADVMLMTALLGEKQFERLIEFATTKDGTVDRDAIVAVSKEILAATQKSPTIKN